MSLLNKLLKPFRYLRGFLPSKLPVGVKEFEKWSESFFLTYDLPTDNKDSIKFTLCTIILHSGMQCYAKPKYYFYITLKASAAKQIASWFFQDIKERQKVAAEAAAKAASDAAQKIEATTSSYGSPPCPTNTTPQANS